ncbi:MAG: AAA family ATPase [Gammaproteobacteria bacterium]|nr:AAA family ATPase [Gammaproteobacteria bacterium]
MTGHITHANLPQADDPAANALIAGLDDPFAFGHPVKYIRLIETHISWVILTGNYAYKIKKPVNLGFLDFSTLDKRHFYCLEELRLNRRFAPEIYLELVEIRGSPEAPRLQGDGEVIEYAIKMVEFPQQCLLSSHAAKKDLTPEIIDAIAARVSQVHVESERADASSEFGTGSVAAQWSEENMVHIANAISTDFLPNSFFQLQRWYRENEGLLTTIDERKQEGFVRECHGDLHLGNMALINGRIILFDCIEFNPELRWIDTTSEVAFVAMDLNARGYPAFCWRFLNRYFEASGDYQAIKLLRYYFVYRALVRAKVEALRVDQEARDSSSYAEQIQPSIDYIELAARWSGSHRAGLVIMHGLSGSGKSTVAAQLVEALGAIQIRSDVIRKRLFNLDAQESSGSALAQGIYTGDATGQTYDRMREIAATIIDADFTVIADATFLLESQRKALLEMAVSPSCKKIIIHCEVPEAELRKRIVAREHDPSEANLEVLEQQLRNQEPISDVEKKHAQLVTIGSQGIGPEQVEKIRNLLTK